ncbi:MAG: hypothetical protein HY052_08300 [Proteobacteria bacterium]|nr:hypothetical protein [Pseudomonadota bacterium]
MASSKKEYVSLRGNLKGNGYDETPCTVRAVKISQIGSDAVTYGEYSIISVSGEIPNGDCELSVNGSRVPLVHDKGLFKEKYKCPAS